MFQLQLQNKFFFIVDIVKTRLRCKIEDWFIAYVFIVYIEKEAADTISVDAIINDFFEFKNYKAQLIKKKKTIELKISYITLYAYALFYFFGNSYALV